MFTSDIKYIDFGGKNTTKAQEVSLEENMSGVIIISSKDEKLAMIRPFQIIHSEK